MIQGADDALRHEFPKTIQRESQIAISLNSRVIEGGALNHRHFSFMGSITKPEKLLDETAIQVAKMLREDEVDAVFLTPV